MTIILDTSWQAIFISKSNWIFTFERKWIDQTCKVFVFRKTNFDGQKFWILLGSDNELRHLGTNSSQPNNCSAKKGDGKGREWRKEERKEKICIGMEEERERIKDRVKQTEIDKDINKWYGYIEHNVWEKT